MEIRDINGKTITVTDLKKAMEQANLYRKYKHQTPGFEKLDKVLTKYWNDIYQKLLALKPPKARKAAVPKPRTGTRGTAAC